MPLVAVRKRESVTAVFWMSGEGSIAASFAGSTIQGRGRQTGRGIPAASVSIPHLLQAQRDRGLFGKLGVKACRVPHSPHRGHGRRFTRRIRTIALKTALKTATEINI